MLYIGNGFFEECVVVDMSGYCIEVVVLLVVEVYAVSYAPTTVGIAFQRAHHGGPDIAVCGL